jgi:hypothetical protein
LKKVHLHEVKLVDSTIHRGEIIYRNQKMIILRLADKQTVRLLYNGIMSIRDLGWKKYKD